MSAPGVYRQFHDQRNCSNFYFFILLISVYLILFISFVYLYSNIHNKLVKTCICAYADTHSACIFVADNYKYLETPEKQQLGRGEVVRYPPKIRNNDNFVAQ